MEQILHTSALMLEGSKVTLEIFFFTLMMALPLGLIVALIRLSGLGILRWAMEFYIWIMRGTPLMALLAFTMNYAAYFAEIFRAGIQSIPRGQYEASKTLGFTYVQTMRHIIIPQMIARVLPPVSNETINLVKDTSLIYILAMNDLLRVARTIVQREFDMTPFVIAAVFYLVMTFVLTWVFNRLEAHYAKYID